MAKEKVGKVASLNPDDFIEGGGFGDIDVEIQEVRYVEWDYLGASKPVLAARVRYEREDGSTFEQHYSAGDLAQFVPSEDGETQSEEGVYALQVGKREQLSTSSNWGVFLRALKDAGFPPESFDSDVSCLEGVYGHVDQLPQPERKGLTRREGEKSNKTILLFTELKEKPKKGNAKPGKAAPAGKAPAGKAKAKTNTDEVREKLAALVVGALQESEELKRSKLLPLIMGSEEFDNQERGVAVKLASDAEFLGENDLWSYDPKTGVLSLA